MTMELTEINIAEINDTAQLIEVAAHAVKVAKKVDEQTEGYAGIDNFPLFHADLIDGLIHLKVNDNELITISPGDWNATVKHLRDVYFPSVKSFAEGIRNAAIQKANSIVNP